MRAVAKKTCGYFKYYDGGVGIKGQKKFGQKGGKENRARVNESITSPQVRVITDEVEQLGIISKKEALDRAMELGLDLVEVAATSDPPVCRIMDYGKYLYEQSKKQAEARKKQTIIEVKEIKLRPQTEKHDLDFKIRNIRKFLDSKNKVKVTVRFRGREIMYADEHGRETLGKIAAAIEDIAVVVQEPKMEGRQMAMFVGPKS